MRGWLAGLLIVSSLGVLAGVCDAAPCAATSPLSGNPLGLTNLTALSQPSLVEEACAGARPHVQTSGGGAPTVQQVQPGHPFPFPLDAVSLTGRVIQQGILLGLVESPTALLQQ